MLSASVPDRESDGVGLLDLKKRTQVKEAKEKKRGQSREVSTLASFRCRDVFRMARSLKEEVAKQV